MYVAPSSLAKSHLSTHQTWGPGVTGNARDAVTQFRAKVEKTTDAAVAEGQKNVQAAADVGARYIEEAKSLANSAITTAAVCLRSSPRGSSMILTLIFSRISLQVSKEEQRGARPSLRANLGTTRHLAVCLPAACRRRADLAQLIVHILHPRCMLNRLQ